jgi:hypothetical protein
MLRWNSFLTDAIVEGLRNQEVTSLLLEDEDLWWPDYCIFLELGMLEGDHKIFERKEVLRAVLGMDLFPFSGILEKVLSLPAEHRIFRKTEVVRMMLQRCRFDLPTNAVLEGLTDLPAEHGIFKDKKMRIVQVILERETMPSDFMLYELGNLPMDHEILRSPHRIRWVLNNMDRSNEERSQELIKWIFRRYDVLELLMHWNDFPSENILKGLRNQEVTRVLLYSLDLMLYLGRPGCYRILCNILEGLGTLDEKHEVFGREKILTAVLMMAVFPNIDVLQRVLHLPINHGIFRKLITFLIVLLARETMPSDAVLEGLGNLRDNHRIFRKKTLLKVLLDLNTLPDGNLLDRLGMLDEDKIEVGNNWILEREDVIRVIVYWNMLPDDAVLEGLRNPNIARLILELHLMASDALFKVLRELAKRMNSWILGKPEILLRVILKMRTISTGLLKLKFVPNVHGIFEKEAAMEVILERSRVPTDSVLNGLGELPEAHQIFQNKAALRKVMDKKTMPDGEELQELMRSTQE